MELPQPFPRRILAMLSFHIGPSHSHILWGGRLIRMTQYPLKAKWVSTIFDITLVNVDRSWRSLATHRQMQQADKIRESNSINYRKILLNHSKIHSKHLTYTSTPIWKDVVWEKGNILEKPYCLRMNEVAMDCVCLRRKSRIEKGLEVKSSSLQPFIC